MIKQPVHPMNAMQPDARRLPRVERVLYSTYMREDIHILLEHVFGDDSRRPCIDCSPPEERSTLTHSVPSKDTFP